LVSTVSEALGARRKSFAIELLAAITREREELWREHVRQVNWELFDRGVESFTWYGLEETIRAAQSGSLLAEARRGSEAEQFAKASLDVQLGKSADTAAFEPFQPIRTELEAPRQRVFWPVAPGQRGPGR
jgi:hypothetical protein